MNPALRDRFDPRFHIMKGAAIVGVACIHFGGSFLVPDNAWSPSFHVGLAANQIFSFAVPLFVFLSGWLLAASHAGRPIDWPRFYLRRFTKIVIPFAIAAAVQFYLFGYWDGLIATAGPGVLPRLKIFLFKLFTDGAIPVLYFVPLILHLYLLYPIFRWLLQKWGALPVVGALAFLHVLLGLLCWNGQLNFYIFCRPFAPFWSLFFVGGMVFPAIATAWRNKILATCAIAALAAMAWNYSIILNPANVGANFESNPLDYAYCRPPILIFDLAVVTALGLLLLKPWPLSPSLFVFMGRHSFQIYLWHLGALLYAAWRYPRVLQGARDFPELVILIPFLCCLGIAFAAACWQYFARLLTLSASRPTAIT